MCHKTLDVQPVYSIVFCSTYACRAVNKSSGVRCCVRPSQGLSHLGVHHHHHHQGINVAAVIIIMVAVIVVAIVTAIVIVFTVLALTAIMCDGAVAISPRHRWCSRCGRTLWYRSRT